MWHASVAYHGRSAPDDSTRLGYALRMLRGVGDCKLGQWYESRPKAYHLRRRLSAVEAEGWELRDIRHSAEAIERYWSLPVQVRRVIPTQLRAEEVTL